MDPNPAPEELPALYRAVLDRVAELEASGQRDARQPGPGRGHPHLLAVVGRPRPARPRGAPPPERRDCPVGREFLGRSLPSSERPRRPDARPDRRGGVGLRRAQRDHPGRHRPRPRRLRRARRARRGDRGRVVVRHRPDRGLARPARRRVGARAATRSRRPTWSARRRPGRSTRSAGSSDPHRAIDWLSTFPQVVLVALGERP